MALATILYCLYVHQLAVHTIVGVIGGGELVMVIVPEEKPLIIEARVMPQDIDYVHDGQDAVLRFPNVASSITPQIHGLVSFVSVDRKQPEPNQPPFYTVRPQMKGGRGRQAVRSGTQARHARGSSQADSKPQPLELSAQTV